MSEHDWFDIPEAACPPDSGMAAVVVRGRELAVFDVDGRIHVTDDRCTHGQARLSDGFLLGHEIECPFHQGRFDVRDGRATCAPARDALRTYPVRFDDGRWRVRIEPDTPGSQ